MEAGSPWRLAEFAECRHIADIVYTRYEKSWSSGPLTEVSAGALFFERFKAYFDDMATIEAQSYVVLYLLFTLT
jgi:hypothetical protein